LQTRQHVPLELSLTLFDALQHRLALMFEALEPSEWQRGFTHPQLGVQTLEVTMARYAWHARHHIAQVQNLRVQKGW
jgi:hypothetical protein